MVVLIHPNVPDHKLAFEKGSWKACVLLPWFGSVGGSAGGGRRAIKFNGWVRESTELRVTLTAPSPISD